jgi:hypothetical protein
MEPTEKQILKTPEQTESTQPSPEAKAAAVAALASEFHEDWRKTRLDADGNYEPRVKSTKDEAWIADHGTNQVDIANSTYDELPSDWQAENGAAADVVVDVMNGADGAIDLTDPDVRSEVGQKIHDAWLSRNEWAKGGTLDVPFNDLPQDEQDKDIDQVVVAQRVFSTE